MLNRILLLSGLLMTIFLLITQGFAFADIITGCLQKSTGKIYNAQPDTEPTLPCASFDEEISWNQEGPQGLQGPVGDDGTGCSISGSIVTCGTDISDVRGPQGIQGPAGADSAAGGAPQFILKDGNGVQMGTVITVNDDSSSFIDAGLQVTNRSVLTALDILKADTTTATVVISVDRFNIRFQHRLLFENPDCLGPARFRDTIADSDFPPAITMSFVGGVPGQPNVRKLYIQADEAEIPAMFLVQSISAEGTCISPLNFMAPSVSAELVDGQLHLTHPGPYTLEGPAGAEGTTINQVQLVDSNLATCEAVGFPIPTDPATHGWCPNDSRSFFIIPESLVTEKSVVVVNRGVPVGLPNTPCLVRLVNPVLQVFAIECLGSVPNGATLNYVIFP